MNLWQKFDSKMQTLFNRNVFVGAWCALSIFFALIATCIFLVIKAPIVVLIIGVLITLYSFYEFFKTEVK